MNTLVRRPRAIIAALVAALALAVVPALPSHAAGPGGVEATVTANGLPVVGSLVQLQGTETQFGMTDATGVVTFADLALGEYTLILGSSPEFQETSVPVTLTEGAPLWSGTIAREPWPTGTGTIAITVRNTADDAPVAGSHVRLYRTDAPGASIDGFTDVDGVFTATSLVAGRYSVSTDPTPDHFAAWAEVDLAEGASVATTLHVLASDAAIAGRVVDPAGNGVAGVSVSAQLIDGSGSTWGVTDAAGYYLLEDAGEGTWTVRVSADANWERAMVDVEVDAATTATAPDLVLTPRFTGTISGLVGSADGIPESTIGGFFDVCVTVVHPDGTPVDDASTVTGGDSFYYFWLAPGDYTVHFEDCDPDRTPHGYGSVYLGGSETLAGATIVTVETLADTWLDTTLLPVRVEEPEPTHAPVPVRTRDLDSSDRDAIGAPGMLRRGETAAVTVGAEYAGRWVSVWLHSRPTLLGGWQQVSAAGTVEIEIPRTHPIGVHELVVQDAEDEVIGWTELRVRHRVTCLFPWLPACS